MFLSLFSKVFGSGYSCNRQVLRGTLLTFLSFRLVCKFILFFIVKPIITSMLQFAIDKQGQEVVFNGYVFKFLLSFQGLLAAGLLLFLAGVLIYYEFSVITIIALSTWRGKAATMTGALLLAIPKRRSLLVPSMPLLFIYLLGILPLANMGLSSLLLPKLRIPDFILGEAAKMNLGLALNCLYIFLLLIFFLTIFTLPVMILEEKTFLQALKRNFILIRKAGIKLLGVYAIYLIVWLLLQKSPQWLFTYLFNAPLLSSLQIWNRYGLSLAAAARLILTAINWILQLFLVPVLMTIIVRFYLQSEQDKQLSKKFFQPRLYRHHFLFFNFGVIFRRIKGFFKPVYRRLLLITGIVIILVALLVWNIQLLPVLHSIKRPLVVGHRGSEYGVENTLDAIDGAILAGADLAEIDVQLSKDNVPIVIHDTNLKRLSGENINIYDLTSKEISQIQVRQNGFTGSIPTLDETLKWVKGRIHLAIELKPSGRDKVSLVDAVMKVVKKYNFMDQAIFFSIEYDLVKELRQKYPDISVGYCIYTTLGFPDLKKLRSLRLNFTLIEASLINTTLINLFREADIAVYAWTVNDSQAMNNLLQDGVRGLVTDDPKMAVAIRSKY